MECPPTPGKNIHLIPRDTPEERRKRLNLDLSEILVPLDPDSFLRNGNLRSSYINVEPMIIKRKKKKKTSNRKKDCEDLKSQMLVKSVHEMEENRERELNKKKTIKPERINEEQRMGDLCRNIFEIMRYDLSPLMAPIHKQEETQH